MKIAIHQPQYFPWLGYFDKMDQADVFVLLDDVQYKKNEWQNRNKIRNSDSWQWITVPVNYGFGQRLCDIEVDNKSDWRSKHLKSVEINYSRAPHFKDYFAFFAGFYATRWRKLAEINIRTVEYLKNEIGITTRLVKSSELEVDTSATQRIIDICKSLGGDTYLSGAGGAEYLEEKLFAENNIKLEYQGYKHPVYEQVFEGFEPYMSVVDLLMCKGGESLGIIRQGR